MKNMRRAVIGAFFILLAVILVRLVAVRPPVSELEEADVLSEKGWLERKTGARHSEFSGGRETFRVKADSAHAGEDGLHHLEGNVEIVDFGRKGGREVLVSAGHAVFNEAQTWFEIFEDVTIRENDIHVESPGVKYDRNQEIFHTVMGASFSIGKTKGEARSLRYAVASGEIELEGDVRLESSAGEIGSLPLVITGNMLVYRRDSGTGEVTGEPVLTHGDSRAEASRMRFRLSEGGETLDYVVLEENVKAAFIDPETGSRGYRIEADEARAFFYPDTMVCRHFRAMGNCIFLISLPGGGSSRLESDESDLYFTPEGLLRDLGARPDVRITMRDAGESGGERRLWAPRVNYNDINGSLVMRSSPDRKARADSEHADIEAEQIVINMHNNNTTAAGEVRMILKSRENDAPVGFFSGEKPVFITCGRMDYRAENERFFFREGVRIWQDRESVSALELDILQKTGQAAFRGGVHSLLFRKTAEDGKEEERLEMRADEMIYDPERTLVRYTGSGSLETQSFRLRADSLAVTLAGEGGVMDRVEAQKNVVIDQGDRQGRGEQAVYERTAGTVVLFGNPVLSQRDAGETKGDRLTFHLDDGRISVENVKRDRSSTVIIR